MGRRKLEIKRIESKSSRQVTFVKRRTGLMKKAKELSILCDVEVALVVFSERGKLYQFSSPNNSLGEIVQRYTSCGSHHHTLAADHTKLGAIMSVRELLEKVESHLEDSDQVSTHDLIYLEEQLEAALLETRARKTCLMMDSMLGLEEKEKMLREENKLLEEEIASARSKVNEENEENGKLGGLQNPTPQIHTFL